MKKKKRGRPLGSKVHEKEFKKMKPGKWYAYADPEGLKGFRRTFQAYAKALNRAYSTKIAYNKLWLCII
jgi:hypothetical protein